MAQEGRRSKESTLNCLYGVWRGILVVHENEQKRGGYVC